MPSAKTVVKTVVIVAIGLIGGAKVYNTWLAPTTA